MVRLSLLTLGIAALGGSLVAAGHCDFGPDTCVQGYVWREAFPSDYVCVTPATRSQAAADNAAAASRREQNGGPFGPDTCVQGFVWREASPTDHVCVTPGIRSQAAYDNSQAPYRQQCDCGGGWNECTQQWFGAAPFCNGGCPDGWNPVRSSSTADSCDQPHAGYCVTCSGLSGNSCIFGTTKTLCEQCVGVQQQSR